MTSATAWTGHDKQVFRKGLEQVLPVGLAAFPFDSLCTSPDLAYPFFTPPFFGRV